MHGALVALDDSFSWQSMALALQIPTQNSHARAILEREFNTLLEVGNIIYISIYLHLHLLYLNQFHNAVLFAAWYREEPWKWRPQLVMMQRTFSKLEGERSLVILIEV